MTRKELNELREDFIIKPRIIRLSDLKNKKDRTLLYGYTCDRQSFHIYIQGGKIHRYIYGVGFESNLLDDHLTEDEIRSNKEYVPNKRTYPEYTDFEFCKLLRNEQVYPTFTSYSKPDKTYKYFGEIYGGEIE